MLATEKITFLVSESVTWPPLTTVTSTEAALFEWVETADHPQFKAISALIKEADLARSAAPAHSH